MVTLETPDRGTCNQVSQIIGVLQMPDRTCIMHEPGVTEEVCLKLIPQVTPLNAGELKV